MKCMLSISVVALVCIFACSDPKVKNAESFNYLCIELTTVHDKSEYTQSLSQAASNKSSWPAVLIHKGDDVIRLQKEYAATKGFDRVDVSRKLIEACNGFISEYDKLK